MGRLLLIACFALVLALPGWPSGAPRAAPPWRPDIAAARRYAATRLGEVAFAVLDQRGRYYGYRAASTAPAASVFKVMLLASFLRMRADRGLPRRDRALLAPMIRRSDSVAATEVRDLVGRRRIERLARVAGMRDFRYHEVWGLSRTSPRDQVRFMDHLDGLCPQGPPAVRPLPALARDPLQRWGIGRVVPSRLEALS